MTCIALVRLGFIVSVSDTMVVVTFEDAAVVVTFASSSDYCISHRNLATRSDG